MSENNCRKTRCNIWSQHTAFKLRKTKRSRSLPGGSDLPTRLKCHATHAVSTTWCAFTWTGCPSSRVPGNPQAFLLCPGSDLLLLDGLGKHVAGDQYPQPRSTRDSRRPSGHGETLLHLTTSRVEAFEAMNDACRPGCRCIHLYFLHLSISGRPILSYGNVEYFPALTGVRLGPASGLSHVRPAGNLGCHPRGQYNVESVVEPKRLPC